MDSELTFRRYQAGDDAAILKLYEETFGHAIAHDYWAWKYLKNPANTVYVYLAFDGERCVGQYAMLPMFLSMGGDDVDTLVALDNMVHPDYQRRGILKKLEDLIAKDRPDDIPYYTFLNQNSVEVYLTKFGWHHVDDLSVMMKPLSLRGAARRKPYLWLAQPAVALYTWWHSRSRLAVKAEPFTEFSDELENWWQQHRAAFGVTQDRSRRVMEWRYNQSPVEYRMFKFTKDGSVMGWAIVRIQEKFGATFGWILDLMWDPGAPADALQDALLAVEQQLRGQCDMLSLLLPTERLRAPIRKAGFLRIPKRLLPHPFYFCVRTNRSPRQVVKEKANWYFSWSLHDTL